MNFKKEETKKLITKLNIKLDSEDRVPASHFQPTGVDGVLSIAGQRGQAADEGGDEKVAAGRRRSAADDHHPPAFPHHCPEVPHGDLV